MTESKPADATSAETSTDKAHDEPHEYPSGLLENHGPPIQIFLKLTYIGFVIFGILYFALYYAGDDSELVQRYNKETSTNAAAP